MENHKQREQHQVYLDTAESQMMKTEGQRQEYIDRIKSQQETIDRQTDMIKTLQLTLESVSSSNKRNENLIRNLTAQIEQLQKMIKDLQDKNQRHNKHMSGVK